jgi:hypothetical protein
MKSLDLNNDTATLRWQSGSQSVTIENPLSNSRSQSDLQLSSTQSPHHQLLAQQHAEDELRGACSGLQLDTQTSSVLLPILDLCCKSRTGATWGSTSIAMSKVLYILPRSTPQTFLSIPLPPSQRVMYSLKDEEWCM